MRLCDLKQMCKRLKLNPTPTKHRKNPDRYELSMDDCIKAIQEYSITLLKSKNRFDPNLDFILKLNSPMLASLLDKQEQKIINDIWNNDNTEWVFEEKYDGIRCFLSYNHIQNECHIYSRALDQSTLLPIDYMNRINLSIKQVPFDFILDCEFILSNNIGHTVIEELLADTFKNINHYDYKFIVFDLIKLGDNLLINQTLQFRRTEAFKLVNYLANDKIIKVNQKPEGVSKEEYYNTIIHSGGEGIIAKNLNSPYLGKRSDSWLKIKRKQYEGLGGLSSETYDFFVSGCTILNNQVNGLELSTYKVDSNNNYIYDKFGNRISIMVGILYDLSLDLKRLLTVYENSKANLNTQFLNKVIEVSSSGYDINTKKFNNLSFICWRLDRTYESCKMKEDFIS